MAILNIERVAIKGVAAAVPKREVSNMDYPYLSEKEKRFLVSSTGIKTRRIAPDGVTAADLCQAAAESLLRRLEWQPSDIQILVFISQTPDYVTPCTAGLLQHRMGLPDTCLTFDMNLGCSAYPYGLSVVAGLLSNMPEGRALLLVGDKSSQLVSKKDKSSALLFSDAGSATALEFSEGCQMHFNMQSDGAGADSLIVRGGAGRSPFSSNSLIEKKESEGITRHELNLVMRGLDIFKFAISRVPPAIRSLCKVSNSDLNKMDYFVFHQANKLINESLRKRLKIPLEKTPQTLTQFGNSSSASVPLTLVHALGERLQSGRHRLLLSGFGVGLSWATAIVEVEDLPYVPLIEIG